MKDDLTIEELEIIDNYIHHKLKGERLADFEQQLKKNPELQAKVNQLRLTQLAIGEAALQKQLETFRRETSLSEEQDPKKHNSTFNLKIITIAASLALLLVLFTYLILDAPSHKKLYKSYYRPDPGLMTTMSHNENYEFQKAMVDYKSGAYTTSIKAWRQQLKSHPESDTLNYFIAAAFQANKNLDSAKIYFKKITQNPQNAFYGDANWYLGLIFLYESDKDEALNYLQASGHPKSKALIQEIKN